MRARLSKMYQDHDVIPINGLNAPLWMRETIVDHWSQAKERQAPMTLSRFMRMFAPNISAPVFALGAPRSGTTFLGECLSNLPEISYYYEPVLTKAAVRLVANGEWSEKKAARIYRAVYAWLMRLQLEPDLTFCEKTPGNCFIIPFLFRTFPQARFIHIVRDGRDSAVSLAEKPWYRNEMKGQNERDPDGYRLGPERRFWVENSRVDEYENTNDRHRCIWLWRRYVEEALEGCKQLPDSQIYTIHYEDLVTEPSRHAEAILDFLGIETIESRVRFTAALTANARQDSVGRWKTALSADEKRQLQNEAGPLLDALGYDAG